jgi:hypothetical protein
MHHASYYKNLIPICCPFSLIHPTTMLARHLIILLVQVSCIRVYSIRLFLIGDSIDRKIVEQLCDSEACGGTLNENWAPGQLHYGNQEKNKIVNPWDFRIYKAPTSICDCLKTNDSIAFLHIFGASAEGPYYNGWRNTKADQLVDSKPRIDAALQIFYAQFPPPDRIVFHTGQWEIHRIHTVLQSPNSTNWALNAYRDQSHTVQDLENDKVWLEACLTEYERNMNERMQQIQQLATRLSGAHPVSFGMRTTVFNPQGSTNDNSVRGGALVHGFNQIVRRMSAQRAATLYDYDADVWSTVGWEYSAENAQKLLSDSIHPTPVWSRLAVEKYLYWRYMANLLTRDSLKPRPSFLPDRRTIEAGSHSTSTPASAPASPTMRVYLLAVHKEGEGEHHQLHAHGEHAAQLIEAFYLSYSGTGTGLRRHAFSMMHGAAMQWNTGDVFWVSEQEASSIPLGPPLPSSFSTGAQPSAAVVNTIQGGYLVRQGYARALPSGPGDGEQVAAAMGMYPSAGEVDPGMLEFLQVFPKPLPPLFREQTLLRPQQSRQVYVVLDQRLRAVRDVGVMLRHGWDFDDVLVLPADDDDALLCVPPGDALD